MRTPARLTAAALLIAAAGRASAFLLPSVPNAPGRVSTTTTTMARRRAPGCRGGALWASSSSSAGTEEEEHDVVVIGSGIGGLCAAAVAATYGLDVAVVESHVHAGGAAHAFERDGFTFDSGPSLFSGLSQATSPNPLKHVFDFIGEQVEWETYDTWGVILPEGQFDAQIGPEPFQDILAKVCFMHEICLRTYIRSWSNTSPPNQQQKHSTAGPTPLTSGGGSWRAWPRSPRRPWRCPPRSFATTRACS